jgi:hypothetical protein
VLAISGLKLVQVSNVFLAIAIGISAAVGLAAGVYQWRKVRAAGQKLLVPVGES